ncbi:uncharacterized protein C9orf85 homolog isoform X1 [Sapajus apella]|uniref:Uncharacterized protein C9orf85 homolog isoform X1 n=2 Tax=Sapajus apella TaxID=9515 RepID=A0A6J3IWU7_SAPAP|nr:uncharacterized protein C9orf85 homolog isoform X1 [Sapajus apella]
MSSQKGNVVRSRPQKHQNTFSFKNDKFDKSVQTKKINAKLHDGVCQHCKEVLEWRVKYSKYRPLSKPKKWTLTLKPELPCKELGCLEAAMLETVWKDHMCWDSPKWRPQKQKFFSDPLLPSCVSVTFSPEASHENCRPSSPTWVTAAVPNLFGTRDRDQFHGR